MASYKFVHLMMHNSTGFNRVLIDMIVGEKDYFDSSEHLFVTSFRPLYKEVQNICDIELYESINDTNMELINLYGDRGDILIDNM